MRGDGRGGGNPETDVQTSIILSALAPSSVQHVKQKIHPQRRFLKCERLAERDRQTEKGQRKKQRWRETDK